MRHSPFRASGAPSLPRPEHYLGRNRIAAAAREAGARFVLDSSGDALTSIDSGVYLVKPSPFCILDEVDAPLDDANVTRFMDLIRQFSESTQFILVTHNKRTMELADRMYGITMQEQGVSKLVAVDFTSAAETDAA